MRCPVGVAPEVAELGPLSRYDEDRESANIGVPACSRRAVTLRQPKLAQRRLQPLPDDSSVAELHFVHSREAIRRSAVPYAIDEEDSNARQRQETLARPFFN